MRQFRRRILGLARLAPLLACSAFAGAAPAGDLPQGARPLSAFPREPLVVETRAARRHEFVAWRADSPAMRAQGLMFVPGIRQEQAMIFVYEPPQHVSMWMKNTLIPLDVLFVDAAGCIVNLHEVAHPYSLESIESGTPVVLVVELKGGTLKALGVGKGDRIVRPAVGWPRVTSQCRPLH